MNKQEIEELKKKVVERLENIKHKPTKCPYCDEDIEDDDEYNEHLVTNHPDTFR